MTEFDFVEVYDGILDAVACRDIIDRFETSLQARRGEAGGGVDVSIKDSWDIPLDSHPAWNEVKQRLNEAALVGFKRYLRKYGYAALAPMRLQIVDPKTGAMTTLDGERVAGLDDATLHQLILQIFRPGSINLQKYLADQGGYPYWHCELYPNSALDQGESLHRVVLWTIYLNDTFREGETEFLYQRRKITPRTGSLLIAPTAFTHTHRGNMPREGDKYIATSWILFRRAESMHDVSSRSAPAQAQR